MVRSHQMAGLILIDGDTFSDTAILDEAGIFRCAVMSRKVETLPCPIVYPDMTGMVDLALDTLAERGRRRIATLITTAVYGEVGDYLRKAMHQRGVETHERWMQIVPHDVPEAIRNNVLMLMSSPDRPDGLFIVDDNLAEGASSGLVMAGVNVPRDVEVVAHCNFPWLAPSVLPMQRVGFDTRQIMETAVNVIDLQRQGQRVPSVTRIGAVLEQAARVGT
jgi:DNA-binding LacI/PurR family transcriptional regulator